MSFKRTAISLVLGLLVVAIGFTFFNKKTVDDSELEQQLTNQITSQKKFADADVSVACPSSEELSKGSTFDCATTIDGSEQTLPVELTDDDGNYSARIPKSTAGSQGN